MATRIWQERRIEFALNLDFLRNTLCLHVPTLHGVLLGFEDQVSEAGITEASKT